MEVEKRNHTDFLLKITRLHDITVNTYTHKSLNISKGIIRSKELSLCTIEEIKSELSKQGVTEGKRMSIKKEGKIIEANTYIMTFDQPKIYMIKIGYVMERVEQFIPNLLRCYNCQKYGHHEDYCRGRHVCRKCGQQDPDHHSDKCDYPYKCANCGCDHLVYARSYESWRLEREILGIKHKNNIPYNEARKMVVGSKAATYPQAVQRNKTQYNNHERMMKKLIQLEPGDWESYIQEVRASLDTNSATEAPTTSGDLAAEKVKSPIQTQPFKFHRANACKIIKEAKKKSWQNYLSKFNISSNIKRVRLMIRKIAVKKTTKPTKTHLCVKPENNR